MKGFVNNIKNLRFHSSLWPQPAAGSDLPSPGSGSNPPHVSVLPDVIRINNSIGFHAESIFHCWSIALTFFLVLVMNFPCVCLAQSPSGLCSVMKLIMFENTLLCWENAAVCPGGETSGSLHTALKFVLMGHEVGAAVVSSMVDVILCSWPRWSPVPADSFQLLLVSVVAVGSACS